MCFLNSWVITLLFKNFYPFLYSLANIFYGGSKEVAEVIMSGLLVLNNKILLKDVKDRMCVELITNSP